MCPSSHDKPRKSRVSCNANLARRIADAYWRKGGRCHRSGGPGAGPSGPAAAHAAAFLLGGGAANRMGTRRSPVPGTRPRRGRTRMDTTRARSRAAFDAPAASSPAASTAPPAPSAPSAASRSSSPAARGPISSTSTATATSITSAPGGRSSSATAHPRVVAGRRGGGAARRQLRRSDRGANRSWPN